MVFMMLLNKLSIFFKSQLHAMPAQMCRLFIALLKVDDNRIYIQWLCLNHARIFTQENIYVYYLD